jgi:hypothetical protein
MLALERDPKIHATLGLTGGAGGKIGPLRDFLICFLSDVSMCIERAHLALGRIFISVERVCFGCEGTAAVEAFAAVKA